MSPSETRALRRATLLLVGLSLARWAVEPRPGTLSSERESAAQALHEASAEELEEARRRATPLAPGERLDPNRATAPELDRLPGVGRATADAMVRERVTGGPYRAPEDLLRVPGVGPATLARLAPHLDVAPAPLAVRPSRERPAAWVDLNRATVEEIQTLPGIGPALAARIVQARSRRRFSRVEDLLTVSGIGPATLRRLRPLVRLGGIR